MKRVNNDLVWAAVVSIVCGIGLASLLSGSGFPLLLIVLVVVAGMAVTAFRRHREEPRLRAITGKLRTPSRRTAQSAAASKRSASSRRSQPRSPSPLLDEDYSRRAGVRSRSLGEHSTETPSGRR